MQIQVNCPQCGGKIDFDEKSFVIRCDFCGSTLHLVGKDQICHFRLKPKWNRKEAAFYFSRLLARKFGKSAELLNLKLIYAPYWRIHGMVFRWVFGKKLVRSSVSTPFGTYREDTKKLLTKLLDLSFPAFEGVSLGLQSLGVRTSALPLFIFGNIPAIPGTAFLSINTSFDYAIKYMRAFVNVGLETGEIQPELDDTQEIGEQYSIVYFPFWLLRVKTREKKEILVTEAISNSTIKRLDKKEITSLKELILKPGGNISLPTLRFIPFKCPECGWELPFHPYNSVHICETCSRGWFEYGGKFHRVPYKAVEVPRKVPEDQVIFLPFWKIKMSIRTSTGYVKSIYEITGRGYQPYRKKLLVDEQEEPMNFMIPAFKIRNSNAFNKIAASLTANPSKYHYIDNVNAKKLRFGGVNLSFSEAEEMSRVVLLSLIPPFARKSVEKLKGAVFEFSGHELLYLPFKEERLFLRDPQTGFAIQKGTVYLEEPGHNS